MTDELFEDLKETRRKLIKNSDEKLKVKVRSLMTKENHKKKPDKLLWAVALLVISILVISAVMLGAIIGDNYSKVQVNDDLQPQILEKTLVVKPVVIVNMTSHLSYPPVTRRCIEVFSKNSDGSLSDESSMKCEKIRGGNG